MQGWSLVTDDRRWIIDFFKYVHRQTSREGVLHDFRASLICKKVSPAPILIGWTTNDYKSRLGSTYDLGRYVYSILFNSVSIIYLNGWILLNVKTMPKILHFLITWKLLLSNVRFSASFRHLVESTHLLRRDHTHHIQNFF